MMGLDAGVFCDCVETNQLRIRHPFPTQLYIRSNGSPEIRSKDRLKVEKHDAWMELPPCRHGSMMVCGYHLGTGGSIHRIRFVLATMLSDFHFPQCPVLLEKVLYCGTHTGDHLTTKQVARLAAELDSLKRLSLKHAGITPEDSKLIASAMKELGTLTKVALKYNKPIAF